MPGIIGRKVGMTSIYSAEGKSLPCTVIEAGPCVVTQLKTQDRDGYEAVQLGFGDRKEKNTPNALKGHFKKANTTPKSKLVEFKGFKDVNVGISSLLLFFKRESLLMLLEQLKEKVFKELFVVMDLLV